MSKIFKIIAMGVILQSASWGASTAVCKGCHGQHWEKSAMGKAKVLKKMSKSQIIKALKGYKNGTYGGSMKGLMKPQVQSLSVEDIKNIAATIKK